MKESSPTFSFHFCSRIFPFWAILFCLLLSAPFHLFSFFILLLFCDFPSIEVRGILEISYFPSLCYREPLRNVAVPPSFLRKNIRKNYFAVLGSLLEKLR